MGRTVKQFQLGSLCGLGIAVVTGLVAVDAARGQTPERSAASAGQVSQPDTPDKDYSAELPRIAPLSPEEEFRSFEVLDGFEVELVASEPLVFDPIAFSFDAQGRLFVVEMRDYSEQETERLGSIALLTDRDGDGKYDTRSTFVERLSWPTAIWPWRDGVLVAEPPRVTWYRDTDGDGTSDQSELWFEGFHRNNIQGLANSFRWGVDGYIHGTSSTVGADLAQLMASVPNLTLRGRDFAIDPLSKTLEPENGGGQHGMSFNRWGDKFVTSNSDHLQQVIEMDRWLSQHPTTVSLPPLRKSIAVDGPQAEVFRISPVEPWRIVRTRLRVSGVTPGIVEGGGRAAGYFTGATGTWIMDGEMGFGVSGFDTALVCDVGSNLVHRKKLESNGLFYTGTRIDAGTELLRSKDIWFRPVQLGDGPDGGLYIADMYREVIEHPKSLPPMIKKHLDLTSGRDRGRIWRLKPRELSQRFPMPEKWVHRCSNLELVDRLSSPIAWQRLAASQALVERNAKDVAPELAQAVRKGTPEAAVLAIHLLHRLGNLTDQSLEAAMDSGHHQVMRHALGLVLASKRSVAFAAKLQQTAAIEDAVVQLPIAMCAAELGADTRWNVLIELSKSREPLVRAMVVAIADSASPKLLNAAKIVGPDLSNWLQLILAQTARQATVSTDLIEAMQSGLKDPQTLPYWLDGLRSMPQSQQARRLLERVDAKTRAAVSEFIDRSIRGSLHATEANVSQGTAQIDRSASWIGLLNDPVQSQLVQDVLVPAVAESQQQKAVESLVWANPESSTPQLIDRFASFTPGLQRAVLTSLLQYRPSVASVVAAIEGKQILPSQIPPDIRQRMLDTSDAAVKSRLNAVLQAVAADRATVIAEYSRHLDQPAPAELGSATFQRVCAQCHRINQIGNDVGPPLKQLAQKTPAQLLEAILDPNREVDPKYANYTLLLADGRALAGIILEESATQLVLAEAGGKRHAIARGEIDQLKSTGVSLMPTGLEQQVTAEQMVALIQFLKSSGSVP